MQFSAIVNSFIEKTRLLLLQTPFLEKKIFRKMFIVADLVSLRYAIHRYFDRSKH